MVNFIWKKNSWFEEKNVIIACTYLMPVANHALGAPISILFE